LRLSSLDLLIIAATGLLFNALFVPPEDWLWVAVQIAAYAASVEGVRRGYRWLRGRDGLGLGDVYLAGLAGLWLEPTLFCFSVTLTAWSGVLFLVLRAWRKKRPLRATAALPFGAFFMPIVWVLWMWGQVL
jgi:leader peptidase (prepilin peptidase) / N-methyltransferase